MSCLSWRKKYRIGPEVEIYHGVDLAKCPYLDHTIVFYEGFLRAGIRFPLRPLVVSFFNFIFRAPQQFTTTSFMALAIFDCLNAYSEYGNSQLGLEHFLFYYQIARSSGNNRVYGKPSPKKNVRTYVPLPKKGKGKVVLDPTDREFNKKWLIRWATGDPALFNFV